MYGWKIRFVSYPPSIAFKAAQLQDEHKALVFLRRIRKWFFWKKNIAEWPHLLAAATEVGLDTAVFHQQFESEARENFQADLKMAKGPRGTWLPDLVFYRYHRTAPVALWRPPLC